jgi:prepilin-type processing-associated H-X9-DG protein
MNTRNRCAYTLFQLLLVLAMLALLFALMLPAIVHLRLADARTQSQNNLKQIALAMHNYHDTYTSFPPGNDSNNFSAFARTLPFNEQFEAFQSIDFQKSIDDKANAKARKADIKLFVDPRDSIKTVNKDHGPTNYLLSAGSKPALADNNGLFYQDSKVQIKDIKDGTSNTMMAGETLKGDGAAKATTEKRQYVLLKKDDLKNLKDDAGVKDWQDNKNIAGNRGASWMDGRFLQTTFTGTRALNDAKPDVSCGGIGGLSGLRSDEDKVNVLLADGSVRVISAKVKQEVWKMLADRADGQKLPDF